MRLELRRIVAIIIMAGGLSACSTSTGQINTPIGKIQLGMYIDDVEDMLGPGSVVTAENSRGTNVIETRAYRAQDGRTYVVYYVNEVVRRWELKEQAPTASTTQPQ